MSAAGQAFDGQVRHENLRYLADLGPLAAGLAEPLRDLSTGTDDWIRMAAAHALYRIGDAHGIRVLADIVAPLAAGRCTPVRHSALRRLADIGSPAATGPVLAVARAVLDSPRRLASHGSWRGFLEDEELRIAATEILGYRDAPSRR
jgi:HEAT repeat protein